MGAIDRLLRYVAVRTPSDEGNDAQCPSSPDEFKLASLLGDVRVSDDWFVYAKVPATS